MKTETYFFIRTKEPAPTIEDFQKGIRHRGRPIGVVYLLREGNTVRVGISRQNPLEPQWDKERGINTAKHRAAPESVKEAVVFDLSVPMSTKDRIRALKSVKSGVGLNLEKLSSNFPHVFESALRIVGGEMK